MSKSVFQQLVEQTCSNANFKPTNNKAQISSKPETRNPKLDPSKSVTNPAASANQKQVSPVDLLIAKQIRDMDAANRAPRCMHVKANGVRCASPAMRADPFCFFHEKFYNPAYDDSFPPLEDANSVQCAILQVLNALKRKVITPLEARVFLYGLKAAAINSRRTTFEPIMLAQVTEYPNACRQQEGHVTPDLRSERAYVTPDLRSGAADQRSAVTQSTSSVTSAPSEGQAFTPDKKEPSAAHTARSASPSTAFGQQLATSN